MYRNQKGSNAELLSAAELLICDEGHILKNCNSMTYKAVEHIKTSRKIILTGTPIQNNLAECKRFFLYIHLKEFLIIYE